MSKLYLDINVLEAAHHRVKFVFDTFETIVVSYSGGKDSTVLLELASREAILRGKKIYALFIDAEVQYTETIKQVERAILGKDHIIPYWICIPMLWRNGISVFQPHWIAWNPELKSVWFRDIPSHDCVISDPNTFDFFDENFGIDEFVTEFPKWLAPNKSYASLVGIRSDESFHRYTAIKGRKKKNYLRVGKKKIKWSTIPNTKDDNIVNLYPIYDWRVEDVWHFIYESGISYNKIYDLMYLAGTSINDQRVCQPYGDEQRRGLDLWHKVEPETWNAALNRVMGVNMGAKYAKQKMLGYQGGLGLPDGQTWKSYTFFLLSTLPEVVRERHLANFAIALEWYMKERYYDNISDIPDEDKKIYNPTKFNIPSWRKFALAITKNDFWGTTIDIGLTKYPKTDIYDSVSSIGRVKVRISVEPFYQYLRQIYNEYLNTGNVNFDFVHPTADRTTEIKEKWKEVL